MGVIKIAGESIMQETLIGYKEYYFYIPTGEMQYSVE